jgi:hypothetical protein
LKHADGILRIHISRDIDGLRIMWTEKAPLQGYSCTAESGFGSKLLDLAINQQLHGTYARTRTDGGMDIEIILPNKLFSEAPPSLSALSP